MSPARLSSRGLVASTASNRAVCVAMARKRPNTWCKLSELEAQLESGPAVERSQVVMCAVETRFLRSGLMHYRATAAETLSSMSVPSIPRNNRQKMMKKKKSKRRTRREKTKHLSSAPKTWK